MPKKTAGFKPEFKMPDLDKPKFTIRYQKMTFRSVILMTILFKIDPPKAILKSSILTIS